MIVLSAGMQKSGTGWYFNLTNDLLIAAGHQDVRVVRQQFHLHGILKYHNCNLDPPTFLKMMLLLIPHFSGNTYVVKTHDAPASKIVPYLMSHNILKATYIYRDPRDVAVSAFEHGRKIRKKGETHTFGQLNSIESAILETKKWLAIWDKWMQLKQILAIRYEDLLVDPVNELKRLAGFLSLDASTDKLHRIAAPYQPDQLTTTQEAALHFNRGVVGRFKHVMSQRELDFCNEHFGPYLQKLGYAE